MDRTEARAERRLEALTRARIVAEAVRILDEGGADALTFRTLAARLSTGPGAIYHHIANKGELLAVATDDLLVQALDTFAPDEPDAGLRTVMLAAFDTLVAHPWLGSQMAAAPWQPAVLTLFDRIGALPPGSVRGHRNTALLTLACDVPPWSWPTARASPRHG